MDLNKIIGGLTSSSIGGGLAGGVAGGALVSALGSKSGRKTAKTLLKVGGLAAVGGLAWKAYQSYQQGNAPQGNVQQGNVRQGNPMAAQQSLQPDATTPQTAALQHDWRGLEQQQFEAVLEPANESAGMMLLRSMISAAMADGQLSQAEQTRIFGKLEALELTTEERGMLFDEMGKPWQASQFTQIQDPVLAIEIYTAAILTIDETCEAGRQHLANLSSALRLPAPLVASLHTRVQNEEQTGCL